MKSSVLFSALAFFSTVAFAQPPGGALPGTAAHSSHNSEDQMYALDATPKSLPAQRLHPASNPGEAEVRCGFSEPCSLGLAHSFSVGTDLLSMIGTPVVAPLYTPGKWLLYDVFGGFQFLEHVDNAFYASGSIGYRGFSYEDSQNRKISTSGLTFKIAYAQDVNTIYTQGLVFSGYLGNNVKYSAEDTLYNKSASDLEDARTAVKRFYAFSRRFPAMRLDLPADIEVINWKATNLDLPSDIHGYVRVAPFYVENYLSFKNDYSWREQSFGIRLALMAAYESKPVDQAGRFSLMAALGPEFATSKFNFSRGDKSDVTMFDLPERPAVDAFAEVQGSYQF